MSADKNLFTPVAILTAIHFHNEPPCEEITGESIMEVFDMMYDSLDCYSREKNEKEPMQSLRSWMDSFYGKD